MWKNQNLMGDGLIWIQTLIIPRYKITSWLILSSLFFSHLNCYLALQSITMVLLKFQTCMCVCVRTHIQGFLWFAMNSHAFFMLVGRTIISQSSWGIRCYRKGHVESEAMNDSAFALGSVGVTRKSKSRND